MRLRIDLCQNHEEVSMIHLDHKHVVCGESIGDLATALYCIVTLKKTLMIVIASRRVL